RQARPENLRHRPHPQTANRPPTPPILKAYSKRNIALGLTVIASAAGLREVHAASLAEPALAEMQDRVARRLRIGSIRMISSEAPKRLRRPVITVTIVLAVLANISGLLYALIH